MDRRPSLSPYQQVAVQPRQPAKAPAHATKEAQGAADLLYAHERMAALLPTVTRLVALKKDCAAILPDMFYSCEVLQCDSGQLVFSVPNAALAAKLKQKLPRLQEALRMRGWQVSSIRLKVQVGQAAKEAMLKPVKPNLPARAASALAALAQSLDDSSRNAPLKAAIEKLMQRHNDNQ